VVELGLAMLYHAKVPLKFWVDAFITANYIINLLPASKLHMDSPYRKLYQQKPSYTHLRVFGCACYPCLRPYAQHKLDPRSLICIFLGYSEKHKGYRCLLPTNGHIYVSRHVVFDESVFPFTSRLPTEYHQGTNLYKQWINGVTFLDSITTAQVQSMSNEQMGYLQDTGLIQNSHIHASQMHTEEPIGSMPTLPEVDTDQVQSSSPENIHSTELLQVHTEEQMCSMPTLTEINTDQPQSSSSDNTQGIMSIHPMQTRLKSGIVKPNPKYACLAEYKVPLEPKTVKSALADRGWYQAMQDEMDALYTNQTWELVPQTDHMNVIGCKWVFKTKLTADGKLDRLKARLVAKGFHQEEGIDFTETFSPVIKHATIRIILSVAVTKNWPIHQLDVKNAFLHGTLNETVYMQQPPGFIHPQKPHHVCLLKKSLYGLRQAPRAWFDKFSIFLLENGFSCSTTDPSLFVFHHGLDTILLLLYVDDIVLTGSSPHLLSNLIHLLSLQFHMKDLGLLHYFLGIEVKQTTQDLFLSQTKYALDLLTRANMKDCRPVSTPLSLRPAAIITDDILLQHPLEYRSLVGGLQYLTITRPDIAYATNLLCQKMQQPTLGDFHKLKRVLRYVKGTVTLGLTIHSNSFMHLYGFADADWEGCSTTRRSTTGFCTYLGSNLISWSAKRQSTVSRSSTEAEYRALASATADLTWVSFVLRDIGIGLSAPTSLFCDNKSAIALSLNPVLHARTKHIEVDFHFVREKVASGSLIVSYIPSARQLADIFTKSLPRYLHFSLRTKLGLGYLPPPNLRGDVKEADLKTVSVAMHRICGNA